MAESEPDARARPNALREFEAIARFDGEVRSITSDRGMKFGTGVDRRVLGKLEDYLQSTSVAGDEQTAAT